MTLIEFFDEEIIDNIMGTLLLKPERTIFLCVGECDRGFVSAFRKILDKRGIKTEVLMETVDTSSVSLARAKIEEIVKRYPDCDFDIAGGSDEMLVAIGSVAKDYNIPLHSVNVKKQSVVSINSSRVYKVEKTAFTVEELVNIHGGKVGRDFERWETYTWERDRDSERDIEKVWEICRRDPGMWNAAIGALKGYRADSRNALSVIWSRLKQAGLVRKDGTSIRYRNELVRYLLTKQGNALEMFTYITAKAADFFDDGRCGVVIDWKGRREVENEIDVFLSRGAEGYFISCKNGITDSDELYKLNTVAKRFGGKYAKKIIVLSAFEPDMSFMNRAEELGIKVIKNVRYLKKEDFIKRMIG